VKSRSRRADRALHIAAAAAALLAFVPAASMVLWVVGRGGGRLLRVLWGSEPLGHAGGLVDAAMGTITLVTLATLVAAPLGIATGLELHARRRDALSRVVRTTIDALAAVPPICIGLACYGLVVVRQESFSAFAGAIALAALETPLIARTTARTLERLPREMLYAAVALGGSPWRTMRHVVIPATWRQITAGVLTSMARAAGEAAPLLLTAFEARWLPRDLASPTPSLAVRVYTRAASGDAELLSMATGTGLALLLLVVALMLGASMLDRPSRERRVQ